MDNNQKTELLSKIKPVQFTDGKSTFRKFMDEYVVHDKGLFIFGPSGIGKTHFVKNQTEKHWIDGDDLWMATRAHPDEPWWTMGNEIIREIDQRSDIVTMYAKALGLWIIGTSQYHLPPDAIVLPNWEKHKEYIKLREESNYDGGATSNDFQQVLDHRKYMEQLSEKLNVPIYESIEAAVEDLTKSIG